MLTRVAGAGLGSVQTIVEGGVDDGPAPLAGPATVRDVAGGSEPGQVSVTTSVTVVRELAY